MEFTGERFHPEIPREIWYEHYHRYAFARGLISDRRVLDLACGEGYGSALMAGAAASVTGVDASAEAVAHARQRYGAETLDFQQGDATALPFDDDCFDAIVSFETIEHLEPQAEMLDEFRRVLRPDGFLVISSPDRRTYSDERDYQNEFHVRELYRDEFVTMIEERFPARRILGQRLAFVSAIWEAEGSGGVELVACEQAGGAVLPWPLEPLYWIAVCAETAAALPSPPGVSLFTDPDESVYAHYYHEIRKNMSAGGIIAERDARIAELEAQLAALENG
ncbi:MAG: methyltransferase domain-containing protein [Pseudomonadota bacterium]